MTNETMVKVNKYRIAISAALTLVLLKNRLVGDGWFDKDWTQILLVLFAINTASLIVFAFGRGLEVFLPSLITGLVILMGSDGGPCNSYSQPKTEMEKSIKRGIMSAQEKTYLNDMMREIDRYNAHKPKK